MKMKLLKWLPPHRILLLVVSTPPYITNNICKFLDTPIILAAKIIDFAKSASPHTIPMYRRSCGVTNCGF
ncbi:hypothetical protein PS377_09340, partial [Limosilactobacillus pontis]